MRHFADEISFEEYIFTLSRDHMTQCYFITGKMVNSAIYLSYYIIETTILGPLYQSFCPDYRGLGLEDKYHADCVLISKNQNQSYIS